MCSLSISTITFPVLHGALSKVPHHLDRGRWCIEIQCAESPQLNHSAWPEDRIEEELDWIAGAEPFLYAQNLPLSVEDRNLLAGRTFEFHQSPLDDPAPWDCGEGWLFFGLYLWEHDLVYPVSLSFVERDAERFRVQIVGDYPANGVKYKVKADIWLTWSHEAA